MKGFFVINMNVVICFYPQYLLIYFIVCVCVYMCVAACSCCALRSDSSSGQSEDGGYCSLYLWPPLQPTSRSSFSLRQRQIRGMWVWVIQKYASCYVCHPGVTVLPSSAPQCLVYVQLPYMEDLRQFAFPSLENNKKFVPSGEKSWDPTDMSKTGPFMFLFFFLSFPSFFFFKRNVEIQKKSNCHIFQNCGNTVFPPEKSASLGWATFIRT